MSFANVKPPFTRDTVSSSSRPELSKKAVEVLDAARRVVDREGADGLTLRAVAREARVPSSLAIYYFGSMAELGALLLDSIWRDEVSQHLQNLENLPAAFSDRVDTLVNFHSTIAKNQDGFRTYCELITHVMSNEATKRNVARVYDGYRWELNFPFLVSAMHSDRWAQANSAVMLATGEGLPLGRLLGDSEEAMTAGFSLLSDLFKRELSGEQAGPKDLDSPNKASVAGTRSAELWSDDLQLNSTSKRLLSAGTQLLHKGGLREITFGNISDVSGESKSLISYYFKSKHGFLDALVSVLLQEWTRSVKSALIDQRKITSVSLIKNLYGEESALLSLFLLQPVLRLGSGRQEMAQSAYAQTVNSLSTLFIDERATCEYPNATAARVFLAALHGLALQSQYDPTGFDLESALRALLRLLPPQNVSPKSQNV